MSRFHRPNIGSIGTQGYQTQRSLLDTLVSELSKQTPIHSKDKTLLAVIANAGTAFAVEKSFIPLVVESLARYAPKGYHFGPSDSDSTDYGYWPDEAHGRNEGSIEAEQRREAEETISVQTAEEFIAHQFQSAAVRPL